MQTIHDVAVIGAGPAGLSAALNLVRARRSVVLIDSNRPRNAATLVSHGFITHDGISPLELRRRGREEIAGYNEAEIVSGCVRTVRKTPSGFHIVTYGTHDNTQRNDESKTLIIATGLTETLPSIKNIRSFYGTYLHSCIECDAYEKTTTPLAFIGETADLAERALFLSHWNPHLIVFTNAAPIVTVEEERQLVSRHITVNRRPIAEISGEKGTMVGVTHVDGDTILCAGGFVRPLWEVNTDWLTEMSLQYDSDGFVIVDNDGRTSMEGIYAAGDCTPVRLRQLIVAAGDGARVGATVNRDMLSSSMTAQS